MNPLSRQSRSDPQLLQPYSVHTLRLANVLYAVHDLLTLKIWPVLLFRLLLETHDPTHPDSPWPLQLPRASRAIGRTTRLRRTRRSWTAWRRSRSTATARLRRCGSGSRWPRRSTKRGGCTSRSSWTRTWRSPRRKCSRYGAEKISKCSLMQC
jgi:hypothetical protein